MPSNFPTSLDALTNPGATTARNAVGVEHHGQHANANDAIEALEAKVGVDGSAVASSLDYKVSSAGLQSTLSGRYVPLVTGLALDNTDAAGNTTKLAAAIAAAPIGSTLNLPAGYIRLSSIVNTRQVNLNGVGYWNNVNDVFGNAQWADTTNYGGTVLMFTATTGIALDEQGSGAGGLSNLMIVGPGTGTSIGLGVGTAVAGPKQLSMSKVLVANFSKNIYLRFCQECRFVGLSSIGCQYGLHVADSFTNNEFLMTEIQSCSTEAFRYEGSCNQFNGLLIQACTGLGIICPSGYDQLFINELWMENGIRGGLSDKAINLAGTGHRLNGVKLSYSAYDANIQLTCAGSTFMNFVGPTPTGAATYTNTGTGNVFINASLNVSRSDAGGPGAVELDNNNVNAPRIAVRSTANVESLTLLDTGGGNGRFLSNGHGSTDFSGSWSYRNYDGSVSYLRMDSSGVTVYDKNFILGTTTGTKFGTAANQKLGFYGAVPLVQQTGVPVTAAGVHAALVALGLITA